MKLFAPHNFGGMSIDGRQVVLERDGSATADTAQVETLVAHGFTKTPPGEHVAPMLSKEEHMRAAIDALPGYNTDVEYVVNGMLNFYEDAFTADAEKAVRAKFPPKTPVAPDDSANKGKGGNKK